MHSIALQKTLIVKKSESYRLFTIPDTMTRDKEKMTLFLKSWYIAFPFYG